MKLLSDFDGVWTHPGEEARAQGELLDARLAELLPAERRDEAREWIANARAATLADPVRWGWAPGGRVAAFADEDPFSPHSALLHMVHERAGQDAMAAALRHGAMAAGSLEAFGLASHLDAVTRIESHRGPGVLASAAAAGRAMLAGGVDIVVVSNSQGDKLARWFGHAGLPYRPHPESAPGALRLRGDARKHVLDPSSSERMGLGELHVELRRPHYEAIVREEAPDAVVGDVFSLDLAVPLSLKRHDPAWKHVRIFWLAREYAPERLRRAVAAYAPEVEVVPGIEGVAAALLG